MVARDLGSQNAQLNYNNNDKRPYSTRYMYYQADVVSPYVCFNLLLEETEIQIFQITFNVIKYY